MYDSLEVGGDGISGSETRVGSAEEKVVLD